MYKEIQNGAIAKSYMTNGLLIQYMGKYLRIYSYIRKPFLIYDFATAPFWISLHMRKIWFSFLSVYCIFLASKVGTKSLRKKCFFVAWWHSWFWAPCQHPPPPPCPPHIPTQVNSYLIAEPRITIELKMKDPVTKLSEKLEPTDVSPMSVDCVQCLFKKL